MTFPAYTKAVCFTGHRDLTPLEESMITEKLYRLLQHLILDHGLKECYVGGAIGLDTVAALTVLKIKREYPLLSLNLIIPCDGQENAWNATQKKTYNRIKEESDRVRILSPFFYNGCMQVRNRELLLSSDLCIAYLRPGTSSGGSLNTVLQAAKLGVPVINLADSESEYII